MLSIANEVDPLIFRCIYFVWDTNHVFNQHVQASFVAEEWVNHALGQAREVKGKLEAVEKAHA